MTARASASRGFCARSFVLEPDLHLPRCQSCHVRELNAPIMARVLRPAPRLRRRREEFCVENRAFVDLRRRTLLRPLRPLRPLRRPLGLQHLQARRRTRATRCSGKTSVVASVPVASIAAARHNKSISWQNSLKPRQQQQRPRKLEHELLCCSSKLEPPPP